MITRPEIDRYLDVLDRSRLVDRLIDGMNRDRRGRPTNRGHIRLFWLGVMLSVQSRGSALVRDIHGTLTEDLYTDDQFDLGVAWKDESGKTRRITETTMQNVSKMITTFLEYGPVTAPLLDGEERRRRQAVIEEISDAVCDVFIDGFTTVTYAIDATNIWSWLKAHMRPEEPSSEEAAQDRAGTDSARANPADGPGEETFRQKRRRSDGKWSSKTAKNGGTESFFGYFEHTVVLAPHGTDDPQRPPPLVARFRLDPSDSELADITIGMLDTLSGATPRSTMTVEIVADRHYQYKTPETWADRLAERSIRQTFDLRADQHGFTDFDGVRFAAGRPHCPATPDHLGTIQRPEPGADRTQFEAFRRRIAERSVYALKLQRMIDRTKAKAQWVCPAVNGQVACPNVAGSIQARDELYKQTGKKITIILNPPNPDEPACPMVCKQPTMVIDPGELRKLYQDRPWGTPAWEAQYAKRPAVEGSYGNRKNAQCENYRRGHTRAQGIGKATLLSLGAIVVYNLRMLRNWHERTGLGDPDNPLLTPDEKPYAVVALTAEQYDQLHRHNAA